MNIDGLLQLMRREALKVMGEQRSTCLGYVSSYDPRTHCARVMLQPWHVETGWLPIAALATGPGCGIYAPPSTGTGVQAGDQVAVVYVDGAPAFISQRIFFHGHALEVAAGEIWLVHQSGAAIKLKNDGSLSLSQPTGATITLDAAGNIAVASAGQVSVQGAAVSIEAAAITSAGQWQHSGNLAVTGLVADSSGSVGVL